MYIYICLTFQNAIGLLCQLNHHNWSNSAKINPFGDRSFKVAVDLCFDINKYLCVATPLMIIVKHTKKKYVHMQGWFCLFFPTDTVRACVRIKFIVETFLALFPSAVTLTLFKMSVLFRAYLDKFHLINIIVSFFL